MLYIILLFRRRHLIRLIFNYYGSLQIHCCHFSSITTYGVNYKV